MLAKPLSGCPLILSAFLLTGVTAFAQSDVKPVLITQPIDNAQLVTLSGNTRPEANAANDRGRVSDSLPLSHMLLQLQRSAQQEQALSALMDAQNDSTSARFQQWLTPAQFAAYGLSDHDLNVITGWLQVNGFTVNIVYPNGMVIDFSGTAGQIRQAFHTEIHNLSVNGASRIANMSDPKIPAALAPAVAGVVSLNSFPASTYYEKRPNYTTTIGTSTYYLVVPADLHTIYNFTPAYKGGISGQGQTITVVEDTDLYSTADWTTFRSTFGLSSFTGGSLSTIHPAPPSGTNNCTDPGVNGDSFEAILDAEYASAAAPSAAIQVASCPGTSTTYGFFIAVQNLVNQATPPTVVSMSYGVCETLTGATQNAAINKAYQQAASEGVSLFVSSGDSAAACNDHFYTDGANTNASHGISISAFTATAYNVSVGGTDFGDGYAQDYTTYWSATNTSTYGSALSYVNEIPWNDSCASSLIAGFEGFPTYGAGSFCNSSTGAEFRSITGGSGGPSNCFSGTPTSEYLVSGTCKGYPKPSWQAGVIGIAKDGVRDIPDVSLFASNGVWAHFYPVCYSDSAFGGVPCTGAPVNWSGAGGTSFASPIMAGVQALINQKVGKKTGNPNPVYYKIAASEYGTTGSSTCNSTLGNGVGSSCAFYDITQGDIVVNCTGTVNCYNGGGRYGILSTSDTAPDGAYPATTGWDFATGLGSINVTNLIGNYAKAVK